MHIAKVWMGNWGLWLAAIELQIHGKPIKSEPGCCCWAVTKPRSLNKPPALIYFFNVICGVGNLFLSSSASLLSVQSGKTYLLAIGRPEVIFCPSCPEVFLLGICKYCSFIAFSNNCLAGSYPMEINTGYCYSSVEVQGCRWWSVISSGSAFPFCSLYQQKTSHSTVHWMQKYRPLSEHLPL